MRHKKRKTKKNIQLSKKHIIGVFLILITAYILFFSAIFKIQSIIILESNKQIQDSIISKITFDIKNQNLILLKKRHLTKRITTSYPQIKELKIIKKFPKNLIIAYKKLEDLAYFSQQEIETKYFVVNQTGVIARTEAKPIDLPEIFLPGIKLEEGMQIITPEKIQFTIDALNYLEQQTKLNVQNIKYLPKAQEIHFLVDSGTYIWLDMSYDYKTQIQKLSYALSQLKPENSSYEYIDLRIKSANGAKIFYK
jgi:hypothetical protein